MPRRKSDTPPKAAICIRIEAEVIDWMARNLPPLQRSAFINEAIRKAIRKAKRPN